MSGREPWLDARATIEESSGTACATCGRQPIGSYAPNPRRRYLCPYCNEGARLTDAGVVVDSFANVCHEDCLRRALEEPHSQKEPS